MSSEEHPSLPPQPFDAATDEPIEAEVVVSPWGFWTTVVFGLAVAATFVAVQSVIFGIFAGIELAANGPAKLDELVKDLESLVKDLESNGLLLSLATIATTMICTPLIFLFARLRRGIGVKNYLGIRAVRAADMVKWMIIAFVVMVASDFLTWMLDRPIVPEGMAKIYDSAYFVPLLWAALIIAAPIFEEFFFRGFLFKGLKHSRLGSVGAIVLTSALWASIHLQYDFYNIASIFVGGLVLGLARLKTHSIYPPLAMHALVNLVATIETAFW